MKTKEMFEEDGTSGVRGSVWPGIVVMLAGLALLGMNMLNLEVHSVPWPLYIIIPGALLLIPAVQLDPDEPTERATILARIGAVLVMIGLVTAFVEVVDHYESWAYAWTLVPIASIVGRMYANRFNPDHSIHQKGPQWIRILLMVFVGLALFFEMVVFSGHGRWWPILLVAVGVYLLLNPRR